MHLLNKGLAVHAQVWVWASVVLAPGLALAGGLGFQLAGFLMGLSAILVVAAERSRPEYLRRAWPIALIVFLIWAWTSMLWSPYDGAVLGGNASLLFGLLIPLLFLPTIFLRVSARGKKFLIWAVIAMGLTGVLLQLGDSASGFGISLWADPVQPRQDLGKRLGDAEMNLGRGQISFAQLIWPIAALMIVTLKGGRAAAVLCVAALALSAYFNHLSIVLVTLFLAGAFAVLAWRRPDAGLVAAFALAVITILFAPVTGLIASGVDPSFMRELPLSWEHRLRMWGYSWELIRQAPLFGHGFDSARAFNELTFSAPDGRDMKVMSLHPHNIGLQIWLETGLVGVMLFVGFLATLVKLVLKIYMNPAQAFATAGLVVATAVNGMATIGVWQHWWWALIVFAAGLICLLPHKQSSLTNPTKK